jgi:hypothetical protein
MLFPPPEIDPLPEIDKNKCIKDVTYDNIANLVSQKRLIDMTKYIQETILSINIIKSETRDLRKKLNGILYTIHPTAKVIEHKGEAQSLKYVLDKGDSTQPGIYFPAILFKDGEEIYVEKHYTYYLDPCTSSGGKRKSRKTRKNRRTPKPRKNRKTRAKK